MFDRQIGQLQNNYVDIDCWSEILAYFLSSDQVKEKCTRSWKCLLSTLLQNLCEVQLPRLFGEVDSGGFEFSSKHFGLVTLGLTHRTLRLVASTVSIVHSALKWPARAQGKPMDSEASFSCRSRRAASF